jgi:hypothetical protein
MKSKLFFVVGIFSATAALLVGCNGLGDALEKAMRIQPDYYRSVVAGGPLEQRYINYGDNEIASYEFSESGHSYKIWYPSALKNANTAFPVVVMANGSGTRFPAYEATFQHLASWGFVVIGDDVDSTATGQTVSLMVDKLQALNTQPGVFQNKIDLKKIGVSGHSQGAVGAVNAITRSKNSKFFTSAYLASMTLVKSKFRSSLSREPGARTANPLHHWIPCWQLSIASEVVALLPWRDGKIQSMGRCLSTPMDI